MISGKSHLGYRLMKAIVSNGVPCLQMRSVGSHRTTGREKEGNKERTGRYMKKDNQQRPQR